MQDDKNPVVWEISQEPNNIPVDHEYAAKFMANYDRYSPVSRNTTDAAEARARLNGDLKSLRGQMARIAELHPNDQPAYPSGVRPFGTGDLRHFIETLDAAILATAEAASGAGEREERAFTPDTREAQAIVQLSEEQELSPQAVMRQALRLYQADFLRRKAGETVTWSGDEQRAREFAGPLASLPPATDPAIEECARIASLELAAALANIEVGYRPAHNEGAREAAERIERRIRALAAAPTIPATGHAATEGDT